MRSSNIYTTSMAPAEVLYREAKRKYEKISGHISVGSLEDIPVPAYARDYLPLLEHHYFSRQFIKAIWTFEQSLASDKYREMVFGLVNQMSADNIIYYRNTVKLIGLPSRYESLYLTGFLRYYPPGSELSKKGIRHMINPKMLRRKDGDITWTAQQTWRKGVLPKGAYRNKNQNLVGWY